VEINTAPYLSEYVTSIERGKGLTNHIPAWALGVGGGGDCERGILYSRIKEGLYRRRNYCGGRLDFWYY